MRLTIPARTAVEKRLLPLPGKHLVFVQYSANHNVHNEVVYNDADIDEAKIVWAREIPGQDLNQLFTYFRNRDVWVLELDEKPLRLPPRLLTDGLAPNFLSDRPTMLEAPTRANAPGRRVDLSLTRYNELKLSQNQ